MSTESSLTKLPRRLKPALATRIKLTELRIANLAMPGAGVVYIYDSVTPNPNVARHILGYTTHIYAAKTVSYTWLVFIHLEFITVIAN